MSLGELKQGSWFGGILVTIKMAPQNGGLKGELLQTSGEERGSSPRVVAVERRRVESSEVCHL